MVQDHRHKRQRDQGPKGQAEADRDGCGNQFPTAPYWAAYRFSLWVQSENPVPG